MHGIDDLRAINNLIMAPIPTYGEAAVLERIRERFPYVFAGGRAGFGFWRPELTPHAVDGPFRIGEVEIVPFPQKHGRGTSTACASAASPTRPTPTAWTSRPSTPCRASTSGSSMPCATAPHPSHAHFELALSWIDRVGPSEAYLTHMNHEVDYADWAARLPNGVLPAHDGLVLEIED